MLRVEKTRASYRPGAQTARQLDSVAVELRIYSAARNTRRAPTLTLEHLYTCTSGFICLRVSALLTNIMLTNRYRKLLNVATRLDRMSAACFDLHLILTRIKIRSVERGIYPIAMIAEP